MGLRDVDSAATVARRSAPGVLALAALALALALAACGREDPPTGAAPAAEQDGPQHVHGLGVDPADGTVFIATHSGLWFAPRGEQRVRRVGDRRQDVMGFTVVGPDHFLGSGHPDPRDDLPPLLGLIESRDAGRSWRSVSLLGKADFHVLRSSGRVVYGYDGVSGRLLVSSDGGRTWTGKRPPGPLLDLAVHPEHTERLVAATPEGLQRSRDGGKSWRPLNGRPGLLSWPSADALFVADAGGTVSRSSNGGESFTDVGTAGAAPAAFAFGQGRLLLALADSRVLESADGGRSWTVRAA